MKKILFVAAIAALSFTSCNKDDDDSSSSTECFDCTVFTIESEYCHKDGDDFITVTVAGESVEQDLEGVTWEEFKAAQLDSGFCN